MAGELPSCHCFVLERQIPYLLHCYRAARICQLTPIANLFDALVQFTL